MFLKRAFPELFVISWDKDASVVDMIPMASFGSVLLEECSRLQVRILNQFYGFTLFSFFEG